MTPADARAALIDALRDAVHAAAVGSGDPAGAVAAVRAAADAAEAWADAEARRTWRVTTSADGRPIARRVPEVAA